MKVIVDIPEEVMEATKNGSANIYDLCGYLMNGKIIEPCEDAISRKAVLDLAKRGILVSNGNYERVCKAINELPPVQPLEPCMDAISRKEVLKIIHSTIYDFMDDCDDDESPLTDKDKLLLSANKAICNNLKMYWINRG